MYCFVGYLRDYIPSHGYSQFDSSNHRLNLEPILSYFSFILIKRKIQYLPKSVTSLKLINFIVGAINQTKFGERWNRLLNVISVFMWPFPKKMSYYFPFSRSTRSPATKRLLQSGYYIRSETSKTFDTSSITSGSNGD